MSTFTSEHDEFAPKIDWERHESVAVVCWNDGENRHNPDTIRLFLNILDDIEDSPEVRAVVIASKDQKNWSQGIDLDWISAAMADKTRHDEVREFLHSLNRVYARLLTYPMPVIAAINGHAFGNGAILACACDFRFMRSDRGFFCFPEVDIGIPFFPGMMAVMGKAIPGWQLNQMTLTGRRVTGSELEASHVVEKASVGFDALMVDAIDFAKTFDKGRGIFKAIKQRRYKEVLDVFETLDPPAIAKLELRA
ncbi:MAG TPA: enoyl-CoA hydratase/isomerase family protein [Myxococcota bacterium]|nr:enoyl-CoA hydratase/isomerase family protein [Myxococcota bacterium]